MKLIAAPEIVACAAELGASGGGVGAARLIALLYDDSVGADEIVQCLRAEPALAARVLKVANSAYYRRGGDVGTFERAIAVLGLLSVRGIAAVGCMDRISVPISGNVLNFNRFRCNSIAVAAAAQSLSVRAGAGVEAEAFMAGLIHNIGLIVLARLRPQAIAALTATTLDESAVLQAEIDMLGIDQFSSSALVAEAWHLPDWLYVALRSHHAPQSGRRLVGTEALPALLALARRCSAAAGFYLWGPQSGEPNLAWTADLGFDDEVCGEVVAGLPDAVLRLTST